MNKLAILALFALVGCAFAIDGNDVTDVLETMEINELSEEESSAAGGAGEEIPENMPKEHFYFRDFCVGAQDEIKSFIVGKVNGAASDVYTILLTSASDVGAEVLRASAEAVTQGTNMIEEAKEKEPVASNDVQENVEKITENMSQNPSLLQRVSSAVKAVITAAIDAARALVFQRLTELKEQVGTENLKLKIEDACSAVTNELQPRLNAKLTESKNQLKKELVDEDAAFLNSLQSATTNSVGCTLSGRVWKVAKFCDILKVAGPMIYNLAGIQ